MRIALVNSEYAGPGGIGTYTRNMARALCDQGHTVYVLGKFEQGACAGLSSVKFVLVRRKPAKCRVVRGLGYRFFWEMNLHWEFAAGVCAELETLFRSKRIDMAEIPDFYGEAYAAQMRFPYVCRLHTPWGMVRTLNGLPRKLSDIFISHMEKHTTRHAAGVSSPSAALLGSMPRGWIKRDCPRAVVPYPHEAFVAQHESKKEFPLEILFLGRLEQRKGFDRICRVLPAVLSQFPGTGALIAGEETAEATVWIDQLRADLQSQGLDSRCRFLGPVPAVQARSLMHRADVVMVPSRFDNFPNVILEAMSAGRCIVACKTGGIPEMVENETSALLFDPDEGAEGLKNLLCRALQEEGLRTRVGAAAAACARKYFSPTAVAAKTVAFYEEVLSRWNG